MLQYIEYLIFRLWLTLLYVMPFRLLYLFSDVLSFILYGIIRYRRQVARQNLANCFPELSEAERHKIERKSYVNLADILLESVKGMTMSEKSLRKHFRFRNIEILKPSFELGRSVILVSGHVCNWEWGAISLGLLLQHECVGIYKPIHNPHIEAYTRKCRGRTGMILAGSKDTGKLLREQQGKPTAFVLIADQNPSNPKSAFWVDFFGRDTAFHHGPGTISKDFSFPVFYFIIKRVRRGYYDVYLEPLIEDTDQYSAHQIIESYARRLELQIRDQKPDWLWTHRRWKHRKPEAEPYDAQ